MAVLDAGRSEVYIGVQDGKLEETILSLNEAAALARSRQLEVLVAEASMAAKFERAQLVTYRSTEVAARVGGSKLIAGQTIDVLALDANYIRRSEAEYKQKMKS